MSVVVEDRKGNPVAGLKQEDFTVLDEGRPQQIAFFIAAAQVLEQRTPPAAGFLPPNAFTNRYDLKGEEPPGAVTVVLFDTLNTAPEDQSYVRKEVIHFLESVQTQDHVAVYGLTTQLFVLHEFTRDSGDLVAAAHRFAPKELAAFDASHTPNVDLVSLGADKQWTRLQDAVNNASGEIADMHNISRAGATLGALEAIADHVSGIPGRKNLVWISGGFPIQIGLPNIGKAGGSGVSNLADPSTANRLTRADREAGTLEDAVKEAAESLNRGNIAVYAIDAKGVELDPRTDPSQRGSRLTDQIRDTSALNIEQDSRDSSKLLADRTGGLAFFGNNDIRGALHKAFEDGLYAYTVGFYPSHGQWDGEVRKNKIEVKGTGLRLRYRAGYYASPDRTDSKAWIAEALRQAADSPLDATSLSMIVTGRGSENPRTVEFHIGIDPKQLLLESSGDHRKGALDLLFLQRSGTGVTLAEEKQHIDLNLEEKQFQFLAKAAMVLDRHVTILPQTAEMRVVIRDAGSGSLGSVATPVKAFLPSSAEPVRKSD
jgi:VWFA-related protein